ncbi:MAG: hypothetical protein JW820_08460 [Spirochaetales bacterium]|nr:hypothetical protein [Spirochaetales bacterium]
MNLPLNRKLLPAACLAALLLAPVALPALELGGSFRFDNLGFTTDRIATDTTFTGLDYFWGGELHLTHELSDALSLEAGFARDDILRHLAYALFEYRLDYFRLGLGTFLGTFNSTSQLLNSGIITSIGLELPGVAFVRFRSDNSIGGRMVETGDYLQERSDISLGFYVPNVICSLNLQTRSFTQKQGSSLEVVDSLTIYSFKTDIYRKNLPFRILLTFGYQTLAKKFIDGATDPTNTLNSIILGAQLDLNVSRCLSLDFALDSGIYSFGQDQLLGVSNPGPGGYLFRASAGFSLDLAAMRGRAERAGRLDG